jgi:hypothetical protein
MGNKWAQMAAYVSSLSSSYSSFIKYMLLSWELHLFLH